MNETLVSQYIFIDFYTFFKFVGYYFLLAYNFFQTSNTKDGSDKFVNKIFILGSFSKYFFI